MSAGDFDYDARGQGYALRRRPDPRIAAHVHEALGDARTVLNVGAGAGSYEPDDRYVLAVEPSAQMRAQRPAGAAPAVQAVAQQLPFDDGAFDAVMAMVTVHQWPDKDAGLRELRRVARGTVVVMSFDPDALDHFWLAQYAPELIEAESKRYPSIADFQQILGGEFASKVVPIPIDCTDGFTEAFYARPEQLLDAAVRGAQSAWAFVDRADESRAVDELAADLESGRWDERFGGLRRQPFYEGSLRLIISHHS